MSQNPIRNIIMGTQVRIYLNNVQGADKGYYIGRVQAVDNDGVRIEPEGQFVPWIILPWNSIQKIMPEK